MSALFTLKFDIEPATNRLATVLGSRLDVALARGINRTADSEKVALGRAIAADMGLAVGVTKAAITVERATPTRQTARVIARGQRIPLIDFKARGPEPSRGRGRGVSYRLPGSRGRVQTGFIATMRSGHRGVFVRQRTARLPIRELFGPSVVKVFTKMVPIGEARRNEVLIKNVQHEIQFALSKSA